MKKILRADMTSLRVFMEDPPPQYEWLGGRGLIAEIANRDVLPTCHPLGKSNKLIFAPGLLAGSRCPSAGRLSVGFKSPITQGIKEANVGGTAGDKIGKLGIKAIILEGQPVGKKIYIVKVNKDGGEILPADTLASLTNNKVVERLVEMHGKDVSIVTIGPSGEMGMATAAVACTDIEGRPARFAARGGGGAVMGAKGVKAIVIDDAGTKPFPAKNNEAFQKFVREYAEWVRENKVTTALREYGTLGGLSWVSNINQSLPVRNFTSGVFEEALRIGSRELVQSIKGKGSQFNQPCMPGCLVRCSNIICDQEGNYLTSGLNFETAAMLGANLGINNFKTVAVLDKLCGDFGIDTIEIGVTLGISVDAGLMNFGDGDRAIALVQEIGQGTTLGRILGQGAAITAKVFGISRVPVVKGQGVPAHDPRVENGSGVTYCTSAMGPDHTSGLVMWRKGSSTEAIEASREAQINIAIADSLGLCIAAYTEATFPMVKTAEIVNAQFDTNLTYEDLKEMGKAMLRQERAFNLKAGIASSSDRLPEFFYEEPLPPSNLVFDVPNDEIDSFWDF